MTATAIKERPILMCGPMVCATLEDKKTQTRRVVNPQPNLAWAKDPVAVVDGFWTSHGCKSDMRCPYGVPRERLWLKETWQHEDCSCNDHKCGQPTHIFYKATESYPESMKWRSSIYMPRWASRITLEITSVRVQRVQEISEEDARAEGIDARPQRAVDWYRDLWDSLNAKRGYGWAKNPWVWVLGFRRIT